MKTISELQSVLTDSVYEEIPVVDRPGLRLRVEAADQPWSWSLTMIDGRRRIISEVERLGVELADVGHLMMGAAIETPRDGGAFVLAKREAAFQIFWRTSDHHGKESIKLLADVSWMAWLEAVHSIERRLPTRRPQGIAF